MCIRTSTYLVCSNCNNQFRDPKYGAHFSDKAEVKKQATIHGWRVNERVKNGSEWDFCPRCWANHVAEGAA